MMNWKKKLTFGKKAPKFSKEEAEMFEEMMKNPLTSHHSNNTPSTLSPRSQLLNSPPPFHFPPFDYHPFRNPEYNHQKSFSESLVPSYEESKRVMEKKAFHHAKSNSDLSSQPRSRTYPSTSNSQMPNLRTVPSSLSNLSHLRRQNSLHPPPTGPLPAIPSTSTPSRNLRRAPSHPVLPTTPPQSLSRRPSVSNHSRIRKISFGGEGFSFMDPIEVSEEELDEEKEDLLDVIPTEVSRRNLVGFNSTRSRGVEV